VFSHAFVIVTKYQTEQLKWRKDVFGSQIQRFQSTVCELHCFWVVENQSTVSGKAGRSKGGPLIEAEKQKKTDRERPRTRCKPPKTFPQ
jgi:hypothetical protein